MTSPVRPAVSAPPTPTNTPLPERTTTVVLGRTHLVAIGALLVIVAAGIAFLAFAALRGGRSSAPETTTASATNSAPAGAAQTSLPAPPTAQPEASSPPSVPPPPAAPTVQATPSVAAPQKTPSVGGTGSVQAAPGGVATAGAASGASKPAGRGTSTGVSPGGSPTSARETASAMKEVVPTPPPAPPPAVEPPAPPVIFKEVRLLVAEGERVREREGMLQLGEGRVSIVTAAGGALMSLSNSSVRGIFVSRSKQPRWRDASGQVVESKIDLGPMGFLRGERNWIILLTSGEPVIMRIEDSALRTVLPALEQRTGQKVHR
jgi:hypothetical protein